MKGYDADKFFLELAKELKLPEPQTLAKMKKGKEAEELIKQSFEKYEKALEIKPDDNETLNNWGLGLLALAEMKKGKKAEDLFKQSLEKFMKAEEIKEGFAAYNISCLYSLLNDVRNSLIWLEKGLKLESTPERGHILEDTDLNNIKDTDEFKKLIRKYRPKRN